MAFVRKNKAFLLLFVYASCTVAKTSDALSSDTVKKSPLHIAHIFYNGNRVTKERVIRIISGLDTGMVFDSLAISKAKRELEATGLFQKVAILSLVKNGAVDLYMVVREQPFFGISTLDFTPYRYRYGQSGLWYCPLIGVEFSNLRGMMETFKVTARFWEWRTLAVSWSKPLLPSPYFIGLGAFTDVRPDNALAMDRLEFSGSVAAGRRCFRRSRIYLSAAPDYQRRIIRTSSDVDTAHFYQAFASVGWSTDRRSPRYDPARGWSFFLETRSNALYNDAGTPMYVQFIADMKSYHRGLSAAHKTAYHALLVARTNDAGIQNRLVLGGLGSVRGYANSGIDLQSTASHAVLVSWEYRFPLYQLPPLSPFFPQGLLKAAGKFAGSLTDLAPRLDGAFIFDYGRVGRDFVDLFSHHGRGYRSGTDFGIGLRLMETHLRRSACLDVVWTENPYTPTMDFYAAPSWQLYLDLIF